MKFSHINTREIHPAYRAVSLSGPARLPYKQALSRKQVVLAITSEKYRSVLKDHTSQNTSEHE